MSESLQFERAEFSAETPARVVCATCNQEVVQSYYELAGNIVCSQCRENRERARDGWGLGRFIRAALAGFVVGVAGAAVWYGVRALANAELGLIAIAIGFAVGKAVSWGSNGKGGWLYQLLALVLTYTAIVMNYIPDIVKAMMEGTPGSAPVSAYVAAFILSFTVPFLDIAGNIIGLLIIAFGLFQAWAMNKRVDAEMTGPYSVAPAATPAPVPNV
jgi:hypothetical protein